MANLADVVKKNSQLVKRGSQLFEAAPESLFSQVQRQGLAPGAAVSPQAAAEMGVTADQAKMAGSAAQVQKAVRESIQPGKQMGAQPTRLVTSEQEQAAKQRAGELSKLEALGTRIGGLVNTYAQEAAASAAQVKPTANEQLIKNDLPNATPEQINKVKAAIETGTIDPELWTLFPQAKSAEELTTALAKYSKIEKDVITTAMKNAFGPDVTLAQLRPDDFSALGLTGLGDIASLLGRPEAELRTMTIDQFQSAIDSLVNQDFDRVQQLSSIANDAFYPANVRASAQAELRDLSTAGVQASEAEVAQMNNAIQSADLITVGDQEMTVAELLSDEGLTSVIASYLDDTDGDYQDLLKNQFPDLVKFIEANKAALKQAANNLSEAAKTSANIKQSNAKLETATDAKVSMTDFNKLVFGADYDPTKPSNTDWAAKKSEAHKILDPETKEFSEAEKSDYARFLNEMARVNPDLLKSDFMNLNAAQLRAKIPAGMSFQTYLSQVKDYHSNLKNLADPTLSNDRAIYQAFGDDTGDNFRTFLKNYQELSLLRSTGLGDIPDEYKPLASVLDVAMADGKLDPTEMADIRNKLQGYLKSGFNLNAGKSLYGLVQGMGNTVIENNFKSLWDAVKDGTLTEQEAVDIISKDSTGSITGKLYDVLQSKDITIEGTAREKITRADLEAQFKKVFGPSLPTEVLDSMLRYNDETATARQLASQGSSPEGYRQTFQSRIDTLIELKRLNPNAGRLLDPMIANAQKTLAEFNRVYQESLPKPATSSPARGGGGRGGSKGTRSLA